MARIKDLGYYGPLKFYVLASKSIYGIGLIDPTLIFIRLAKNVDSKNTDGIFISRNNLRTIEIIGVLERNVGKPMITSNQASFGMALKVMRIHEKVDGFGLLLRG